MNIKCPHCGAKFETEDPPASEQACPSCHNSFVLDLQSSGKDSAWEKLLDPADPAGYFSNFPPEDDFNN